MLTDKAKTTSLLLASGADIHEMNAVRKHLSGIKGGRLAAAAFPAATVTLAISDVVGDELSSIGSGPTVADHSTFAKALSIVEKYGLGARMPEAVMRRLKNGATGEIEETPKPGDPALSRAYSCVIASNEIALEAAKEAAQDLGYASTILSSRVTGEAREVGVWLASLARQVKSGDGPISPPAMLLSGGETTVTLKGSGRGGRNQELALSAAIALDGSDGLAVASVGTDGVDGVTDAAGAFADSTSIERGKRLGLAANSFLEANDSYSYFEALGDMIVTGPTGTNVMDIQVVVIR